MSKFNKIILLLGLVCVALALLFKFENEKKFTSRLTAVPKKVEVESTQSEVLYEQKSFDVPSDTMYKNTGKKKKGLCQYSSDSQTYVPMRNIIFSNNGAKFWLLPYFNAECIKSGRSIELVISHHHPSVDMAGDVFGKIQARLTVVAKYPSYTAFFLDKSYKSADFGFNSEDDFIKYLKGRNVEAGDQVYVVKYEPISGFIPRTSAAYDTFPGVKMLDLSETEKFLNTSDAKIVDVSITGISEMSKYKASVDLTKFMHERTIIDDPANPVSQYSYLDVSKWGLEDPILIMGENASDRASYNFAEFLLYKGFKKVFIAQHGVVGLQFGDLSVPVNTEFRVLNIRDLVENREGFAVIDVRPRRERKQLVFKDFYSANFSSPDILFRQYKEQKGFKENGKFSDDYRFGQEVDINELANFVLKNKVVIVGQNDFDWKPIYLLQALKKINAKLDNLYLLKGGIDQATIYYDLRSSPLMRKYFTDLRESASFNQAQILATKIQKNSKDEMVDKTGSPRNKLTFNTDKKVFRAATKEELDYMEKHYKRIVPKSSNSETVKQ